MNQRENRMSDTMRRVNELAPPGAPAALGEKLKEEFLRHHTQRRRNQAVRISLLAAGLAAAVVASVFILRPRSTTNHARHENLQLSEQPKPVTADLMEPVVPQEKVRNSRAHARVRGKTPKDVPSEADRFFALPTYDPAIPVGDLQMVRLGLPGRALQLVGYPVSEDIADRRVIADVLLAQDGTPYALRLVQSSETGSFTKEH